MSALRTALRPALTPALGSARRGVSRYFTTFDNVAQAHITLTSAISLLGDFDLTVDVSAPFAGARMILGDVSAQACLFINDGNVSIRDTASVTVSSTTTPVIENELNRIRAVKTSGNVELFVNGASVASGALGDFWFDRVGIRFANDLPFNGKIANLAANDNGSNVLDMPINRYYTPQSNTVLDQSGNGNHGTFVNVAEGDSEKFTQNNEGDWIGEELILNGMFNNNLDNWSYGSDANAVVASWASGRAVLTRGAGGSSGGLTQTISSAIGGLYELRFNRTNAQGIAARVDPSQLGTQVISGAGESLFRFTSTSSNISPYFWNINTNSTTTIDDVSVKRILEVAY